MIGERNRRLAAERNEEEGLLDGDRRIGIKEKTGYGLGHIHNDLCGAIWFSYSLVFFQLIAQAGPLLSGILIFIGQTADAIATPFIGYIVDHGSFSRKTWHLIGTVMSCMSFPMVFTKCPVCTDSRLSQGLYYSAFIIIFQCGWALVQISHLSILPEIAHLPRDRAELTAYRYTATMVSNVAVYLIALGFLYNGTDTTPTEGATIIGPSDALTFQEIAITANLLGVVTSIIFQLMGKRSRINKHTAMASRDLTSLFQSPELYKIAGVYTASRLFLNVTMEYLPLYITEVDISRQALASVPLILFVSSALTAFLYDRFTTNTSHTVIYYIGWVCSFIGCLLIFFNSLFPSEIVLIYIAAITFGVGTALIMVVSLSLAANLIGVDVESGAFVYSAVTFADKLINGIVVVLIQYTRKADTNGEYHEVLVYLNAGLLFLGLLIFITLPSTILTGR